MDSKVISREFIINKDNTVSLKEKVVTNLTKEELESKLIELDKIVKTKKEFLDKLTADYNEVWSFMLATQDTLNKLKG